MSHTTIVLGSTPEARPRHPPDSKDGGHSRGSLTSRASKREGWLGLASVPTGSKATLLLNATLQGTAPPLAREVTLGKTVHLGARFPHLS